MAAMRAAWHCRVAEKKAAEQAAADRAREEKEKAAKAAAEAVKAVPAASLVPPSGQMVTVPYRVYEMMTKQIELLTGISNKLAFIVDELTGVASPKGGDPA